MKKDKHTDIKIRNSTNDFLVFSQESGGDGINVMVANENVWLTQKLLAKLYEVDRTVITKHLQNVFAEAELDKERVCANFAHTAEDGKTYKTDYYSLEAIIAVGYRVNSDKAKQFRVWATNVLKQFATHGYVLDKERLKNDRIFSKTYFDRLLEDIREIRLSERKFYQKITDIYATAFDYNPDSDETQLFFKTVQNKLHYAIHGHTAPEIVVNRANAKKENMGLTTWETAPSGKIRKSDVSVAKNYLTETEMKSLERIVSAYLEFAEFQANERTPMSQDMWKTRLDLFLTASGREILHDAGKVSALTAKIHAETEFDKYRVIQDRKYNSAFDKFIEEFGG